MKLVFKGILVVLLAGVWLVGCGGETTAGKGGQDSTHRIKTEATNNPQKKVNAEPKITNKYKALDTLQRSRTVAVLNEKLATVYKKKNQLVFKKDGLSEKVISEQIASNHYWLVTAGNYVYVFWWEKFANQVKGEEKSSLTGKVIYVRASQDGGKTFGKRKVITTAGGVLPKLRFTADADGHIVLVYLDERRGGFNIYANASQDGGKTWKDQDLKLDHDSEEEMKSGHHTAVSPNIAQSGNEVVASWQQLDVDAKDKQILRLYSRVSHDFGKTWEKEELVDETDKTMSYSLQMYADKGRVFLIAGMQKNGIVLFTKRTNQPWKKIEGVLPDSNEGNGGSHYRFTSDDKYLYVTYVHVEKVEGSKVFWHTKLARFDKAANRWVGDSFRFDSRGMGVASKGGYQDITLLDDGTVVVVWEDFRRILPLIAMNYSLDQGKTWLNIPLVLSRQDIVNNSMKPFIRKTGKQFKVFYNNNIFPEQAKPEVKTMYVTLNSPKSAEFSKKTWELKGLPSDKELKQRLKERFNVLKDARLNKKWKQAWPIQDPLYRNLYKKGMWLRTRDRLIFRKMDLSSVKLDNPYGYTLGQMVYDLNPDFIDADPKDPKFKDQKKNFVLKWGWFVDDWYLITETGTEPYLP